MAFLTRIFQLSVSNYLITVSVMPRKLFQCKACGDTHERPINSKCQNIKDSDNSDQDIESVSDQMDINKQILNELKQLNGRISKVEEKVDNQDRGQVVSPKSAASAASTASRNDSDLLLPSLNGLRQSRQFQNQVDQRL